MSEDLEAVAQPNEEVQPIEINQEQEVTQVDDNEGVQTQSIEEGAAGEETKPKSGKPAHERINELTRKRYEAERAKAEVEQQAAADRQRLAQLEAILAQVLPQQQIQQQYSQDPYYPEQEFVQQPYQEPIDPEQLVNLAVERLAAKQQQDAWVAKVDSFASSVKDPDAIDILYDPTVPSFAPEVVELLFESKHGSDILSHLAKNRDEIDRLARLPIHRQALELSKLEQLVSRPAVKISSAPAPAPTIGGRGGNSNNFETDLAEAEAAYLRGEI